MAEPDPIQEQLAAARRSQILDAATQVFSEKGFHGATIREVAQAAGIADGTIYNYFANKHALLLSILDRLNETPERQGQFDLANTLGIDEWAPLYFKQRYAAIGPQGRRLLQVVLAEALVNRELREHYSGEIIQPTYALAERFFKQWVAQGQVRPVNPALAVRVTAALFLGVIMLQLLGDPVLEGNEDELTALMADMVLHGFKEDEHDATDGTEPHH
jgi:AcrR family transcriptional regulator